MTHLTLPTSRYFSSLALHSRNLPLLANRDLPPFFHRDAPHHYPAGSPKGKKPLRDGVEEEVSDREWELRVGQYPPDTCDRYAGSSSRYGVLCRLWPVALESDLAVHIQPTGRCVALSTFGLLKSRMFALTGAIASQGAFPVVRSCVFPSDKRINSSRRSRSISLCSRWLVMECTVSQGAAAVSVA